MGHGTGVVLLLYIFSAPLLPLSELLHCSFLGSMLPGSVLLQGLFGNICRQFCLPNQWRCYWNVGGRRRGCCQTLYTVQNRRLTPAKSYPTPNVIALTLLQVDLPSPEGPCLGQACFGTSVNLACKQSLGNKNDSTSVCRITFN